MNTSNALTSRQRLLRTLSLQEADHLPCCFMSFTALRKRVHEDFFALAKAELAMGLDSMLFIPVTPRHVRREHPDLRGLPVRFHPAVQCRESRESTSTKVAGESDAHLHKTYTTPAGELSTVVCLSEDWPHGDHIPFIDDYQVPRALKPLVSGPQDLEPLRYLLQPPAPDDVAAFQNEAAQAKAFAHQTGVLLAGGWGVGMDLANWLCGMQALMLMTLEQPAFVDQLLQMIHAWNLQRMQVVLSAGVDLYIRRAWYEGCDFITPDFYRQSVLPRLKAEADLAHQRGSKFGYICTSGTKPLLDCYLDAGIDVLIGLDPVQGTHSDMALMKQTLGHRICLWGGVSGAMTLEQGAAPEIRQAVQHAIHTLGPRGFILSPVDNITIDAPRTWENIRIFIDEWKTAAANQNKTPRH